MHFSFRRHIDDLGRIVIPKEFRNKLNFNSGELLDMKLENGNLIITKSKNLLDINKMRELIDLFEHISDYDLIFVSEEKIVACSDGIDKSIINKKVSNVLIELAKEYKSEDYPSGIDICEDYFLSGKVYVKSIIDDGCVLGLIMIRVKEILTTDVHLLLSNVLNLLVN